MNCCNNNNKSAKKGHKGHGHPMWMMLLCCGAPIIILAAISLLGTTSPGIRAFLTGALPFICPIMMLVMMPLMLISKRKDKEGHEDDALNQLEEKNNGGN